MSRTTLMLRLVRAEFYKLRTTSTWWIFTLATLVSTTVMLIVDCVNANSLLKPFDQYVALEAHGHGGRPIPAEFLAHMRSEWELGHSAVTQATTIYTAGQLIGVLLACLLGIVLITSEFHQQTATTTFLLTPHRDRVVAGKLGTAVGMAFLSWLLSTIISVTTGAIFLHHLGYGTQLGNAGVLRAIALNLAAYAIWAVFGIGFGALIRSQLGATVSATVLYLIGATAAASVFELIYTYLIPKSWILAAQVVVPAVASTVMISPTKTFDQSPPQWVGAAILIGYGILAGVIGTQILRRRDIA
ncbi:ABC transporter permease [Actinoplanes subtropicus]|uniref:ABC transporter permease n=1 Tax=Actinoplanes subtropicus TaxID=543632 RepID=UPI000689206F|nr:ABC transporter permease [Actinoplanes subtropicus]